MNKVVLPLLSTVVLSSAVQAQSSDQLGDIVVTASRTAQSIGSTLSSVSIISRADIDRLQPSSVPDLLQGLPGVSIVNNGGRGKNTSLFLRGMESDHVLVMMDGIKVGSATSGQAALQNLPVDSIERIEVVRGPRASLYGSEALGGVIQIFTRKGSEQTTPRFSISLGSDNTRKASAGVSGREGETWFNFDISAEQTDGYNSCTGLTGQAGCFTEEPDEDGHEEHSAGLRVGHELTENTDIELNLNRTEGVTEYDGSFSNSSDTVNQVVSTSLFTELADNWQLQLTAGRSWDQSKDYSNGVYVSHFDTVRDSVSLQNNIDVTDKSLLSVGFDYQLDTIKTNNDFAVTSRDNKAIFAQYQIDINDVDVELGLRRDDNEQFGGKTTGHLGLGYRINDYLRLTASFGTAFKAPTFNELYFPFYGNANLKPEESDTLEIGVHGKTQLGNWSVNLYQTDADQLIAYDSTMFAPNNLDEARIRGLELVFNTTIGDWSVRSSATLLDTEQKSGFYAGNQLARRAEQTLRVDLDRDYGDFATGLTLKAESDRFDDLANASRIAGFATVDLRANYRLASEWQLKAKLVNLFDKDYETVGYYPQSGRGLMMTLVYQP